MKNSRTAVSATVAIALLFGAGVVHLFRLRFEQGDIYAPYSSFRADPLGAKALYESLKLCPGVSVERSFEPIERASLDSDTVLFYLGDTADSIYNGSHTQRMPGELAGRINSFVRNGGRLVITFLPRIRPYRMFDLNEDEDDTENTSTNDTSEAESEDAATDLGEKMKFVKVRDWLGLAFDDQPLDMSDTATWTGEPETAVLPETLSCHSSLCFTDMDETWTTIYERAGKPVLVQKTLGKGTLVLSAVTYFVSNEALRDERYPTLLAWLVGDRKKVVFDEYHHGVARTRGTATLVRQYGLHWLAGGLILLALLYVWRNSVSLVPPFSTRDSKGSVEIAEGKDSSSALVNLLRRNIPSTRILDACLDEWRKSCAGTTPEQRRRIAQIEALASGMTRAGAKKTDPAVDYNRIAAKLKETRYNQTR